MVAENKVSLLLDEEEALAISDAINILLAIRTNDEAMVITSVKLAIYGMENNYDKDILLHLAKIVHHMATHFTRQKE